MPAADIYSGEDGYKELCKRKDIDLVYIAPDWKHHFLVAYEAMNNGKHVAVEVPAAMNLTEIWKLIDISEKKRLHCMMLENCCYDFFELNSLNMAQKMSSVRFFMFRVPIVMNYLNSGTHIGRRMHKTS